MYPLRVDFQTRFRPVQLEISTHTRTYVTRSNRRHDSYNEQFYLAIHSGFFRFIPVSVLRSDIMHFIDQFKISFGDYL